jgi:hypothetical protein
MLEGTAGARLALARGIVTGGRDGHAGSGSGDKPRVRKARLRRPWSKDDLRLL